ncbi:MAG TPA: copper homeostasis protein CutC [Gemmatimonadaceae bacterium]|nr:copper homeostasis protein CutC [Gemmatimonadaceae bacterium]
MPASSPPFPNGLLIEICVDSVRSAVAAAQAGAGRLELCAHPATGGTTPTTALLEAVRERVEIPVFAMVRPRAGDFRYDADELDVMRREAATLREAGAAGIVSGALRADGSIDAPTVRSLLEAARPLPFTFHRAFDLTRDLDEALDALLALGVDRVLTSGAASTALLGIERLASLVRQAGDRLAVMAGGGVRAAHVADLVRWTGVREVHARPTRRVDDGMQFRRLSVVIEKPPPTDDNGREELDPAAVEALVAAVAAPA